MRLPAWASAFVLFRAGDGLTTGLMALSVLTIYGQPAWAAAAAVAAVNLVAVPATIAWGRLIQEGRGRRRLAVTGFTMAGFGTVLMAQSGPLWSFVLGAMVFAVFGVATAPAAATLILEGRERSDWGHATAALSLRTGVAFVVGIGATLVARGVFGVPFPLLYSVTTAICWAAAYAAYRTIVPYAAAQPVATPQGAEIVEVAMRGARRFERASYLPFRIREPPRMTRIIRTPAAAMLIGIATAFAGTAAVLATYAGILDQVHGYSPARILVASAPASFVTLAMYSVAGRTAGRHGDVRAWQVGAYLRILAVPGLAIGLLLPGGPLPVLLVSHAIMGASFAFLQVGGPCIAAAVDPESPGAGVGAYHGAVALGVLVGSALGATLLYVSTPTVALGTALSLTVAGVVLALGRIPARGGDGSTTRAEHGAPHTT